MNEVMFITNETRCHMLEVVLISSPLTLKRYDMHICY